MKTIDFNLWMFIAGLGVFLFGMFHLENGLKDLAGNSFKKLLQKSTNKYWKGVLTGSFFTAVLQSSSLVTLLVLAFLGAGMISIKNSIGVVFGANLGTTVTAWIVATIGFKLDISDFSFPFLGIGTLSYILLDKRPVFKNWGVFLIGFGLLFLGLDFMKKSIEGVAGQIDLSLYSNLGLWVFLLIGLIITVLIQSSTAMTVIVLSALNANLIDIYQSFAIIIGANIGTTSTGIIASFKGSADKKRLATANLIFNLVLGTISFILLKQFVYFTIEFIKIKEPLMELVFLNSLINFMGIIIFYPFIHSFAKFMNNRFKKSEPSGISLYIKNVDTKVPDVAIKALENEISRVYSLTVEFIMECLLVREEEDKNFGFKIKEIFRTEKNLIDLYNQLKELEDEIINYYTKIQSLNLSEDEVVNTTINMLRLKSMIFSAKSIKDVISNIKQMSESDDELALDILSKLREFTCENLNKINKLNNHEIDKKAIEDLRNEYEKFYNSTIDFLYKSIIEKVPKDVSVSSITNAIKKIVSSLEELTNSINISISNE